MHILIAALHRPSKPTGVCRYAANLARCLADSDNVSQITFVTGVWQRAYFERAFSLSSRKIRFVEVAIKNSSVSRNFWFLFGLPKLVRQLSPDVVHLSFPIPFLRSLFPCSVVSTIHDLYPYECPENFGYVQAFFNRSFLNQCIYNSDGLACVSLITLERLKEFLPSNKLQKTLAVIYNYVDFENTEPKIPEDIKDTAEDPFLLCVAQHRKNKNLDLLIDSFSSLLKNCCLSDLTKLIIVGSSGPETENIYSKIQALALQHNVVLLSSVEDAELCWLYQNCQLFAIPSSTEGFCIPVVEALYFSSKVVCSDIPILREIGSSQCTYFKLEREPNENLERAILQTLEKSYRDDSSNPSRDLRFSKANATQKYLKFYAEVL